MRFQLATARLGLAALLLGVLAAAVAVMGVRQGTLSYALGYQVMIGATLLGLIALFAALAWTFSALRRNRAEGRRLGLPALVGALLLLYPPLSGFAHRLSVPSLFDVTSDTEHAPRFAALLKFRGPGSNAPDYNGAAQVVYKGQMVSTDYVLHKEYPNIYVNLAKFLPGTKQPVATLYWRAFKAVNALGWTIIDSNAAQGRIEATTSSFWFGRIADIVIRVEAAGPGARTDIRIQSRNDTQDNGAIAEQVKRFFRAMRAD